MIKYLILFFPFMLFAQDSTLTVDSILVNIEHKIKVIEQQMKQIEMDYAHLEGAKTILLQLKHEIKDEKDN